MFKGTGFSSMLKDGARYFSGVDEAVLRNIEAVKKLASIIRTSMGPYGQNKMVINHLDKIFITDDAATIIRELEVIHPAAKMVVMASESQQQEIGDNTNLVVVLAGQLLAEAENLLRMGLHTSDIIAGYTKACEHALKYLEESVAWTLTDVSDPVQVQKALTAVLASKQYGHEDFLSELVTKACIQVNKNKSFNVDNVRVVKIEGGSTANSFLMNGLVVNRDTVGTVKHVKKAKIGVFACPIDVTSTETKGVVSIKNADQLLNYNKSEEKLIEQTIKEIADVGINVIVTGANFSDMALHFMERHKIMGIKIASKFEMRRLCKAVSAVALVRLGAPTPEETGLCDYVSVEEIADNKIIVFKHQEEDDSQIATIVVRGATSGIMDDVERAIDDGVNVYKTLCRDGRLACGAGAVEMGIATKLTTLSEQTPGLDQYALRRFASALESIPRLLAETAGLDAEQLLANLRAAHKQSTGVPTIGIDLENNQVADMSNTNLFDSVLSKYWAIKYASDAAIGVLRVDQIIMARPAGGPKPRGDLVRDEED